MKQAISVFALLVFAMPVFGQLRPLYGEIYSFGFLDGGEVPIAFFFSEAPSDTPIQYRFNHPTIANAYVAISVRNGIGGIYGEIEAYNPSAFADSFVLGTIWFEVLEETCLEVDAVTVGESSVLFNVNGKIFAEQPQDIWFTTGEQISLGFNAHAEQKARARFWLTIGDPYCQTPPRRL